MMRRADFLKKRMEDTLFLLRIYEMYNKKMPTDTLSAEISEGYRRRYSTLSKEYICLYGEEKITYAADGGTENYDEI